MDKEYGLINTKLNREARKEREDFKNFLATFAFFAVRNSSFLIHLYETN